MSYILDNKTNLGSIVIPVGVVPVITVYSGFSINQMQNSTSYFNVSTNGTINIGSADSTVYNNVIVTSGIDYHFSQITDITLTDYLLTKNDYAIEIIADSINTVTLPTAVGNGGRTYVVSRGSDNNNLTLQCQAGENIDTRSQILLSRKHVHLKLMSNGQDSWYII
jgi:hypothetical protein